MCQVHITRAQVGMNRVYAPTVQFDRLRSRPLKADERHPHRCAVIHPRLIRPRVENPTTLRNSVKHCAAQTFAN